MAVYKATYCYPMLNSLDIRITESSEMGQPYEWLKCKIDSSNKEITGYKIRVLDSSNNQIFPFPELSTDLQAKEISPVSELRSLEVEDDAYANSGLNGTFLYIPFFQTYSTSARSVGGMPRQSFSRNTVYYKARYSADYVIGVGDDYAGDWVYNSTTDTLINESWDGQLNGEAALVGETVVIITSTTLDNCGIWTITASGVLTRAKDAYRNDINGSMLDGERIVIRKGKYHNSVYEASSNGFDLIDQRADPMWVDVYGNPINLTIEGGSYKWEITLYQGDGTYRTANVYVDGSNRAVPYMDYLSLSNDWLDMVLNSGQIMGSTNRRIQIANNLGNTDALRKTMIIPAGTANNPLVIQGKFVQLIDIYGSNLGNRAYIQTYDSTYGHIYPMANSFDLTTINAPTTNRVAIYKHSNNPEEILDAEIVACATVGNLAGLYEAEIDADNVVNIPLYANDVELSSDSVTVDTITIVTGMKVLQYYAGGWAIYQAAVDSDDGTVTWTDTEDYDSSKIYHIQQGATWKGAYLANSSPDPINAPGTGLPAIDGYSVREGDLVLVKNQTKPYENGVYIAHAAGPYPYDPIRWERSGSYDQWANFIGAIIYVRNGAKNGGKNFESLANVGGTLYSSTNLLSGSSALYFVEERPIILFANDNLRNVDIYSSSMPSEYYSASGATIDGIPFGVGMTILVPGPSSSQMRILTVTDVVYQTIADQQWQTVDSEPIKDSASQPVYVVSSESIDPSAAAQRVHITWDVETINIPSGETVYYYINDGKTYGHHVVSRYSGSGVNTDNKTLYYAYILKNTQDYTYVSPYVGMQALMKMKLLNNKVVTYFSGDVSSWITINKVTTSTWQITHAKLMEPLVSADPFDNTIPYKYEIRSYFKSSDENPFVTNETPYLKLTDASTGFSNVLSHVDYNVLDSSSNEVPYQVQTPGGTLENYLVYSSYLQAIASRHVTLQGLYVQPQQASWESYRWILTDYYGNVLQDTGKKYDKSMKVSFYGLTNETIDYANRYYAILYVEDTLGITSQFAMQIRVDPESYSSLYIPFTATYECDMHAVKLNYSDNSIIYPSVDYGIYAAAYDADNIQFLKDNLVWDNSISYDDDSLFVSGPNGSKDGVIPNLYTTNELLRSGLSYTEIQGVNYAHYFKQDEYLTDESQQYLTINENECSFESVIELDDDYCGDILELKFTNFEIDCEYASLILRIPDNFNNTGHTVNDLYGYRNVYEFLASIKTDLYGIQYSESPALVPVTRFDLSHDKRYNFQKKSASENGQIYEYQNFTLKNGYSVWYHKGGSSYLNSSKAYGNLCLITSGELSDIGESINPAGATIGSTNKNTSYRCNGAPIYWVDKRSRLSIYNGEELLDYDDHDYHLTSGINLAKAGLDGYPTADDANGFLYWPDADETNSYWAEEDPSDYASGNSGEAYLPLNDSTLGYPVSWTDFTGAKGKVVAWIPKKRHPGSRNSKIHIVLRLDSISPLFEEMLHNRAVTLVDIPWENYKWIILAGTDEMGTLTVEPINE